MITHKMNKAEVQAEMAKAYPEAEPGTELYADLVKMELQVWVTTPADDDGDPYGLDYYFVRDDR